MAPSTPKSPAAKPKGTAKAGQPARPAKAEGAGGKPASAAGRPAKPAAKGADAPAAMAKTRTAAKSGSDMVRLKDIVEGVAAATGLKKPDAKKAVDATLAAIGTALAQKSILALPPLGKLRVAKASAGVMTLKLRLAGASRSKGLALADDDEDS